MVGRALSETKKLQLAREKRNDLMDRAVKAYRLELKKPPARQPKGARKICADFENLYRLETGLTVKLSHVTLIRLADGGRTLSEANAAKTVLKPEEVTIVIDYICELGDRGFPLSHKRLKEHAEEILRARLGNQFPEGGLGKNWTSRFIEKHSKRIGMGFGKPLESKRGRAVNPATNEAWFSLLGSTITEYDIKEETTWAVDEAGFQPAGGIRERVMGAKRKGPMYQQRDGNRETITVLVTICADGSATPPAVIFKGSAYQASWKQDNPADAS